MDSSYFNGLQELEEFFAPEVKPTGTSLTVVSNSFSADHPVQGIYLDEESVDLTALLEAYDKDSISVASTSPASFQSYPSTEPVSAVSNSEPAFPFSFSFNHQPASPPTWDMYGSDTSGLRTGPKPELTSVNHTSHPNEPTHNADALAPMSQIVSMDFLPSGRPAPGKAPKASKSKKRTPEKNTCEYRQKRDRNNVAVRKSREKTKVRVMDTEKRVKELEDENMQLQSKITLLTKELNVLKSLFTNAGVLQPSFHMKDEQSAN